MKLRQPDWIRAQRCNSPTAPKKGIEKYRHKWYTSKQKFPFQTLARSTQFCKRTNIHEIHRVQWIGLRENLQGNPIFNGKIYGFL
jgi:hypothetical protein